MTKKTEESLIEFPCDFTFKIICKKSPEVKQQLINTLTDIFQEVGNNSVKEKESKNNNYCSYSITVNAPNKSNSEPSIRTTQHQQERDNVILNRKRP